MSEERLNITCPNCGFEYPDNFTFCPECGQKNEDVIITFKEMLFDALGAFFAFDSKAIRSIPRLLFLPGALTVEYIKGKRETYLAPFRLYLFVSIILFLVLPLVLSEEKIFKQARELDGETIDSVLTEVQEELVTDSISTEEIARIDTFLQDNISGGFNFSLWGTDVEDSLNIESWPIAIKMVKDGYTTREAVDSLFQENTNIQKLFLSQGLKLQTQKGKGLMAAFLDKASYTLFLFLPLFALLLKLLYIRRKHFYIEHLIFSLHFFSFFFLLIILYVLFIRYILFIPIWPVLIISLIYLYAAMYRTYSSKWAKTFFKWALLVFTTTSIIVPFFFVIVLSISMIFY